MYVSKYKLCVCERERTICFSVCICGVLILHVKYLFVWFEFSLRGQGEFLQSSRRGHPHGGTPGEPINYSRSDTGTPWPVIDASCAAGEPVSHAGRGVKDLPQRKGRRAKQILYV